MCTITGLLPVVTPDEFDTDNNGFVLLPLEGLVARFPFLAQQSRLSCYAIIYCTQGAGAVAIDSNSLPMVDETVICIGSNSVLRLQFSQTVKGWMILFSASFFSLKYNEHLLS